jgi:hypothetical protein
MTIVLPKTVHSYLLVRCDKILIAKLTAGHHAFLAIAFPMHTILHNTFEQRVSRARAVHFHG